jgi:hypothetical protein
VMQGRGPWDGQAVRRRAATSGVSSVPTGCPPAPNFLTKSGLSSFDLRRTPEFNIYNFGGFKPRVIIYF